MTFEYEIIERRPTAAEHKALWEAVGWGNVNTDMTAPSIAGSVYSLVVVHEGKTIGMGRIVGDGAMYYYIQDVAVLPEFQSKGIGRMLIEKLLAFIRDSCKGAPFVGLFAAHGKDEFYKQFGFEDHSPGMTGMFMVMEP